MMKNQYEKKSSYISQDQHIESKQPQSIQEQQRKEGSFAQRSQSEIQVYNQIKEKNQAIKQQKQQLNKSKVFIKSNSNGNRGYTNIITLSLIVSFVCGALFMIIYMFIRK